MANNRALEIFNQDILFEIVKYLTDSEIANLVMVCPGIFIQAQILDQKGLLSKTFPIDCEKSILQPFFISSIFARTSNLKQAGLYLLQGKKKEALDIIYRDNGLLLEVIPCITLQKHPSYHCEEYKGRTLLQLSYITKDFETSPILGDLIEKRYGLHVKAQQFNEQFPHGVKGKSYRGVFDALIKIIAADETIAFVDGQNIMNDTTQNALKDLESSLTFDLEVCTTGVHFDLQIIADFVDAYEEGAGEFKNEKKEWDQRAFYWRCVFGTLEKFMSYFVVMALNEQSNFSAVMEGKKEVTRSTLLRNGDDVFNTLLGVSHWCINGDGGGSLAAGRARRRAALKTFVGLAQKNLDDLSSNCSNQQTLICKK